MLHIEHIEMRMIRFDMNGGWRTLCHSTRGELVISRIHDRESQDGSTKFIGMRMLYRTRLIVDGRRERQTETLLETYIDGYAVAYPQLLPGRTRWQIRELMLKHYNVVHDNELSWSREHRIIYRKKRVKKFEVGLDTIDMNDDGGLIDYLKRGV